MLAACALQADPMDEAAAGVSPVWAGQPEGIRVEAQGAVAVKVDPVPQPISVPVPRTVGPGEAEVFEFLMESDDVSEVDLRVHTTGGVGNGNEATALRYTSNGTLFQAGATPGTATQLPGFSTGDRIRLYSWLGLDCLRPLTQISPAVRTHKAVGHPGAETCAFGVASRSSDTCGARPRSACRSINRKLNVISLFKNGEFIAVVDDVTAASELQCSAMLTNKGA